MKLASYIFFTAFLLSFVPQVLAVENFKEVTLEDAAQTIIATRDPFTKISPSHTGHPGYENVAFLYDKAVDALILNAAGHQKEARDILDYFADRLNIPLEELKFKADNNGIYGIVKLINHQSSTPLIALTNAIDISSRREQGLSLLEFSTTPGPTAFMIFAFLNVDPHRYLANARQLGEVLIYMQDSEGGIRDGDRAADRVYTEPHVDAHSAFMMLYLVTLEKRWLNAAQKSRQWFFKYVYHPESHFIDQGLWAGKTNQIFALDCYTWTMAGPMGDAIPIEDLQKLTHRMLNMGSVHIHMPMPDNKMKSLLLVDFTNSDEPRTIASRDGFHPMGSIEWTGGMILALQKNSVRFWNAGKRNIAIAYKALAEIYLEEIKKCFYRVDDTWQTFYATGQGLEVAPFGGLLANNEKGWLTPYFYSRTEQGKVLFKGGSLIGAWPFLPERRINPFILNDPYGKTYEKIPCTRSIKMQAQLDLVRMASRHFYQEKTSHVLVNRQTQINEPRFYNKIIWEELQKALLASRLGKNEEAKKSFSKALSWANKILDNPSWIEMAKQENLMKSKEFGGLIPYPWGTKAGANEKSSSLNTAIWRYPLLNEVGMTMWACAVIYAQMNDTDHSRYWIKRILKEVPLHQIAVNDGDHPGKSEVIGYWNALVSWDTNPSGSILDERMKTLYHDILKEGNYKSYQPKVFPLVPSHDYR